MRLADFIDANIEPILVEWEVFARSIWPDIAQEAGAEVADLRDHAEQILRATVSDMRSEQTTGQQAEKSQGKGDATDRSARMMKASELHGLGRLTSGFELCQVVAEYRALRASVLRLWRESDPVSDVFDVDDVTRFNECIDQSLTESVRSYTEQIERDREAVISSEQAALTAAENANRAKDMFLATLSHELRTPLNAIVGWVGFLRMEEATAADLAEGLDVIERNAQAQVKLIEDVLDVSRITSGKLRLEMSECDLVDTMHASIDAVRPAAEARDISLDVQLDPIARRATCDAVRIQQVVWNLMMNAIKFTPKGGKVRVTLDREHSGLRIIVSDNGQGISPELLPHIFERFRQADSSTRRSYGGLGLGLSIVNHLAEMHGGTVEAHSAGEGQGATFTVRLPIKAVRTSRIGEEHASAETDDEGTPTTAASDRPPIRLDGLRILVVDDELDARRILLKVLESVDARVTTAGSAAEAISILADARERKQAPDVIVSDVGMPEQDGYDLIREVRRRGHLAEELPAVALTAFAHDDDVQAAESAGFQAHLSKPVDLYELTAAISRLVGRTG